MWISQKCPHPAGLAPPSGSLRTLLSLSFGAETREMKGEGGRERGGSLTGENEYNRKKEETYRKNKGE